MPNNHAALSASSSHRWLECPPSAKLCAELPDTSSEYAQEGTDAHTLRTQAKITAWFEKLRPNRKSEFLQRGNGTLCKRVC